MRFSLYLSDHPGEYDCHTCDEKKRQLRNCHNRAGYEQTLLEGADEWRSIPASRKHALKIPWAPTKFMACPLCVITPTTWDVLNLVNDCASAENTDLLHLPYACTILEQPPWFREAVKIVRAERGAFRAHKMDESRKKTTGKGKK